MTWLVVIIPIVTLDKIYLTPDDKNVFFLDCTRVDGSNKVVARGADSIDEQVDKIVKKITGRKIILADDVVFSGGVLREIISLFEKRLVKTVRIISSISTEQAYRYFNDNLKDGLQANFLLEDSVIDQVCERDFYFGIAGSGIMLKTKNGLFKAPYFKPYGNPVKRASIPSFWATDFSIKCLDRNIYLWEEIDKLRNDVTMIKDLPEKIIYTDPDQPVVKTLKKERQRL